MVSRAIVTVLVKILYAKKQKSKTEVVTFENLIGAGE